MGVPVVLGNGGIREIKELKLTSDEQSYLNDTVKILKKAMQQVDIFLGMPSKE
jgi:malate/lactate dehydrogenase